MSVKLNGRRLLRVEARNSATPVERKPTWIKTTAKTGPDYKDLLAIVGDNDLHTVCQGAACPNIHECWEDRESTFPIGGDQCTRRTRRCDFCQITSAKPESHDPSEPLRVASSVKKMGLRYTTVTGVCRDDLADEGAWLYTETIRQIHATNPGIGVEMLAPDLSGKAELITITQYLRPNATLHPIDRWVEPAEFEALEEEARAIGYSGVLSGPLVRSSYRAGRLYRSAMDPRKKTSTTEK